MRYDRDVSIPLAASRHLLPESKEVHFFGTDLYSPHYSSDLQKYLSLFAGATDEKRVGEGSVWYLYSKLASREIKEFCPAASILIMLRNPVDMIYSLHGASTVHQF